MKSIQQFSLLQNAEGEKCFNFASKKFFHNLIARTAKNFLRSSQSLEEIDIIKFLVIKLLVEVTNTILIKLIFAYRLGGAKRDDEFL